MLMGGPTLGSGGLGPEGTRRCWSCNEVVMPGAVACRHCGASLIGKVSGLDATARTLRDGSPRRDANLPSNHDPVSEGGRRRAPDKPDTDDTQWSDADFERISQTAGLPREDPRERDSSRTGRPGARRFRRPSAGPGFARVFATTASLKRSPKARWATAAALLVVAGVGAGWLAGRWDGDSLIGQQYHRAVEAIRSFASAEPSRQASPPTLALSPAVDPAPHPETGADRTVATLPATPPIEVSPRVPATPPVPAATAPADQTAVPSLVPMLPTGNSAGLEPAPEPGVSGSDPQAGSWSVRDVQRELARLGFYTGGVDGQVGPLTRQAVRAFQEAAGLPLTGRIEPTLVAELANRSAGTQGARSGTGRP